MRSNLSWMRRMMLTALLPAITFYGCGDGKPLTDEGVLLGKGKEKQTAIDESLQKINEKINGIPEVVIKQPREALDYARQTVELIFTMPSREWQLDCLQRMEKAILAVPTTELKCADRQRAMDAIFNMEEFAMMGGFYRVNEPASVRWNVYFNGYRRWAKEIAVAKEQLKTIPPESRKRYDLEAVIRFVSANHRGYLDAFEHKFVVCGMTDYPKEEYDVIKKMLEDYLGRPLRTKEQIDEKFE